MENQPWHNCAVYSALPCHPSRMSWTVDFLSPVKTRVFLFFCRFRLCWPLQTLWDNLRTSITVRPAMISKCGRQKFSQNVLHWCLSLHISLGFFFSNRITARTPFVCPVVCWSIAYSISDTTDSIFCSSIFTIRWIGPSWLLVHLSVCHAVFHSLMIHLASIFSSFCFYFQQWHM